MKKITLQTVVDAINHCSDKQQKEMLRQLNKGHQSWAGIILGEMIKDYVESIDEENEGPFDEDEWNRDADKAGIH